MSSPSGPRTADPRLILALLAVILVAQGFYAGVDIFLAGPVPEGPLGVLVSVAWVVYATMIGTFAYGAWRRKPWAWALAVAIAAGGLVLTGAQILAGDSLDGHLVAIIIDGALLYYLNRPNVKELFAA